MSEKYLCIHCHFYQPPRENPWLEEIECQDSAYPFHDWNERITQECYRTNSEARILDKEDWVVDVVNNYSKISFNFGPTLLSWMQEKDPQTYKKILEGDKQSIQQFAGHGSAIAQAYNHIILPLANSRDQETQVIWGLVDFKKRFGRDPESMWLPETAVDIPTLEVLAKHGMKYAILAPRQAKAFRPLDSEDQWTEITNEQFDTKLPYLVRLPSGNRIAVFFYDGGISKAVAFEGLLHNGELFANRLNSIFQDNHEEAQLAHIATDGETYGHHHRHGEMALAFALDYLEKQNLAVITNYGQYLELHPPHMEAQIHENSSWSCVHGVERWRSNCGCNSGQKGDWNQSWREPLRKAFDFVRDTLNPLYEKSMQGLVKNPWDARNAYINVILDRSDESLASFLKQHCTHELSADEINSLLKLLEIQRHLLLMYTSCGWFFDEISGVETVQNIQYAYRAIDLSKETLGVDLENEFKEKLALAKSNIPDLENGKIVFEKYVFPSKVDFLKLGAHFAVDSVFEKYESDNSIYCYRLRMNDHCTTASGNASISWGQGHLISKITHKDWPMVYGVIHLGDHNINAGVAAYFGDEKYQQYVKDLSETFHRADFPNAIRVLDKYFGPIHYSLKDLFKNEQRKVTDAILKNSTRQIQDRLTETYEKDYPLICYFNDLHVPLPKIYEHIAEFVQNRQIGDGLHADLQPTDTYSLKKYLEESKNWKIKLDESGLQHKLETCFEVRILDLENSEITEEKLDSLLQLIEISQCLPFQFDLAPIQSLFFRWFKYQWPKSAESTPPKDQILQKIHAIGDGVNIRMHA